jgi:hypothetical protein
MGVQILTELHGRLIGLDSEGRLVVPAGIVSGDGLSAGAGITDGDGAVYRSVVVKQDGLIKTQIYVDLTGLSSSTTDLDIIGVGTAVAHLGQHTVARNGILFAGRVICLELPAGGVTDIDLYAATEGTGAFDTGIATLTETALLTKGGAWSARTVSALTALPAANQYLYLTGGAAGTAAPYTAGQFLIELEGYEA